MPQPTIGRIVVYQLSSQDAERIGQQRAHSGLVGNVAREGDHCPAMVVRVFGFDAPDACNLKVQLDGEDTYWATSRHEGEEPGTWSWPERA